MALVQKPETRYAKNGDVHLAYQVFGEGPLDLVWVPGFVSHLEFGWENPALVHVSQRLAAFARTIAMDKRGTGLSDRGVDLPTMEQRMDDLRAVMDAAGSQRAALLGVSEGGPLAMLLAATYPQRVSALVLCGTYASFLQAPGYPWGISPEQHDSLIQYMEPRWGTGVGLRVFAPSVGDDPAARKWWAQFQRLAASPGAIVALMRSWADLDVRHVLSAISCPTLVLHRTGDRMVRVEHGRYLGEHIPGAKFVEFPGDDHIPWCGDADALVDEMEEFLTGVRHAYEPDRILATVMFTDVVESTRHAAGLGDRRWRELMESHNAMIRRELQRHRGSEVKTIGDGFLATFDGPERAVRCARAITELAPALGMELRAGLHTGQCDVMGDDIGGLAVNIAARVSAMAQAGEVLVSSTVKDLVAGSGIPFEDRGLHELKGVPDEWHLYRALR